MDRDASGTSWHAALRGAAVAGIIECGLIMALVERSVVPPALVIAVLFAVGAVMLGGTRKAGVWITTVAFGLFLVANVLLNGPALGAASSFWDFAVTWAGALTALVGLIAGIATWRGRTVSPRVVPVVAGGVLVAVAAIVIGLVASLGYTNPKPASGDIAVVAKDSKFERTTLVASSGPVTFFLDNADNTLHDFHIAGVKSGTKNMPANHKARFTVNLAAGTYSFKCDFHNNMKGTITVH